MSYIRIVFFFFFKQKTAYEMRISDWSSDVCSSDLFFAGIKGNAFSVFAQAYQSITVIGVETFVQKVQQNQWPPDLDGKDGGHNDVGEYQEDHAARHQIGRAHV